MKKAMLATANGLVFEGRAVGAEGQSTGELVFNTSMTGYQEILTDPSYAGQVVTMTYPLIGNYGVNDEDVESRQPFVAGFVMRECCFEPSNWRAKESLPDYLKRHNVVAIDGVDTRRITKMLRTEGAQKCCISTVDFDHDSLIRKAIESPDMEGSDYVKAVSVKEPFEWSPGFEGKYRVVAMDYGIKYNILRLLEEAGCKVIVMPAAASFEEIMAQEPDGIFLSNGPGDPDALPYVYPAIREMLGKKPVFGICLGHQVLGIALGGKTFKLKFGHRGGNQPVQYAGNRRVEITAQNHGFAVDLDSLDSSKIEVTHMNLNDRTVEGLVHKELPVFSVQYHPEASPGPHDSRYLFAKFVDLMEAHRAK